ncbi:low affinity immunoglobulin epsilon Fc receptor-like [Saccostrea echinata]|uniref:low affinity immunoglobulin epsilon Fc receptor-like n=1 Tax=Saccostrea echinata TaxID=191078 RepID=UPI002A82C8A3|nr:low affinity immunoglobulin epsilon Fc receptor-like [Saccostrea echinata]
MRVILAIQLFFCIYKTFGQGTFPENNALEKSASFPVTTSSKQFSVLREILNQESLVRFSMVQKIQTLVMDVVESRNLSKTLEGRLNDVIKELSALKITDNKLKEEIAKLKQELKSGNKFINVPNFKSLNDSEVLFLRRKTSALEKEIEAPILDNTNIMEVLVYLQNKGPNSLKNETFSLSEKYDKISQENENFKNPNLMRRRDFSHLDKRLLLMENDIRNLSLFFNVAVENTHKNISDILELRVSNNTSVCEKGWVSFNDHCYFFASTKMNFRDALEFCSNVAPGAILLEIQSSEEERWINIQTQLRGFQHTWIGVTDISEENEFVSVSDARAPTYVNWLDRQPDNHAKEDCVEIFPGGKWNDRDCSATISFICKLGKK